MRTVISLAWPVMVSMLSYTVMTAVDAIFVGQLGTVPLAAVGLAGIVTFLVFSFGTGVLRGTRILVAQHTGARQPEEARSVAVSSLWFAAALGVVTMALAPLGPVLFPLLGSDPAVTAEASTYYAVRLLGAPLLFGFQAIQSWFQGRGDTRTPMYASVVSNLANTALTPMMVFGFGPIPAWEVAGAAASTVLTIGGGLAWLAWRVRRELRGANWRPQRAVLARLWRLGAPLGVQMQLEVGAYVAFAAILTRIGAADLAAHVIVVRICSLSFLPGNAIGEAACVLAGQSIGARRPEGAREAHRAAVALAVLVMAIAAVVFVLFPGPLVALFGAEPEVAALAERVLWVAAAFQVFDAVAVVSQGTLGGVGDTRFVMVSGVLAGWIVMVPLAWLLAVPAGLGVLGAWIALATEIAVLAVVCLLRVLAGERRREAPGSGGSAPRRALRPALA